MMVRSRRLELPRDFPTATSTLRVYQFRHDRTPRDAGLSSLRTECRGIPNRRIADFKRRLRPVRRTCRSQAPLEWRIGAGLSLSTRPWPRWRPGWRRSASGRAANWSGWSSTRRSTPPAPAPGRRICWRPRASRSIATGRGGQYTYHGPGQRVGYVMLDLQAARPRRARLCPRSRGMADPHPGPLRRERRAARRAGSASGSRGRGRREDKIAAIGVRVRQWVSFHGIAINLDPDLDHFSGIVPCGISASVGVTSLADLGIGTSWPSSTASCRARSPWCWTNGGLGTTRGLGEVDS